MAATAGPPVLLGASPDVASPMDGDGSGDGGAPAKRKRGRPRKYEDLTEEERKQRRAVDNRHAAKRSYYRRINKMTELEQVRLEQREYTPSRPRCVPDA
jgi:hypothetical protein